MSLAAVEWLLLFSRSVMSDSLWPHGLQHASLPCPHHLLELAQIYVHWVNDVSLVGSKSRYECVLVAQSCLTLCNPMDSRASSSPVHGISQIRILEWIAMPFSRRSFWPRNQTLVFCIAGIFFTIWATREAQIWVDQPRNVVVPVTHSLDESAGREDEKIQIDFRKFLRTNVSDLVMDWIWGCDTSKMISEFLDCLNEWLVVLLTVRRNIQRSHRLHCLFRFVHIKCVHF